MKQVIHDLYSGDEVDTLDFQWDANWRPIEGTNPFKALSDFALGQIVEGVIANAMRQLQGRGKKQ